MILPDLMVHRCTLDISKTLAPHDIYERFVFAFMKSRLASQRDLLTDTLVALYGDKEGVQNLFKVELREKDTFSVSHNGLLGIIY